MNGLTAAATSAIPKGAVEGAIIAVVVLGFLAIAVYQWGRLNAQMAKRVKQLKKEVDELKDKNRAA
jgi:hypothetical protein